jgi:hypothetical protein
MGRFFILCVLIVAARALPAQQYFPPGVLDSAPQGQGHGTKASWYAMHLKALHEPSLWEMAQDPKAEAHRFLWLRSFHHPIAVRLVVRSSGSGWMHTRMTSGKGGYGPGRIIHSGVFWLTKTKTQSFLAAMDGLSFWNLPTLPVADERRVGLDGAQWIVEGVKDGQYHVVDRFSPGPANPVREIGMLALKLGRMKIRSAEVY